MPGKSFNSATSEIGIDDSSDHDLGGGTAGVDAAREIACVMLSRRRGGLEQSLLDICEALTLAGHRVTALVHPDWPGTEDLRRLGMAHAGCTSLGEWDPYAAYRLRRAIAGIAPSVVVTIGRRASALARRALGRPQDPPQVAQTPNYGFRHLIGLDHVIATTDDIARALIAAGQPAARISVVPNAIRLPREVPPAPGEASRPPVIGTLGRFIARKGFAEFIDALALLRAHGHQVSAMLAGAGPDERALRARAAAAGLGASLSFPGWITDKAAFFSGLDVFCVPSRQEPFGIVVLEGFAHGRATVVTDAEGPRQIVTDGVDGLVVPRGDAARLADAFATLIGQPALRRRLAEAARVTVRERYDLAVIGARLSAVLCDVAAHRAAPRAPGVGHGHAAPS